MAAKKTDKTDRKPRFHIVGVPRPKDIRTYARNLEAEMNKMHEAGYAVQLFEQKNGSLIMGQDNEEPPQHPFIRMLQSMQENATNGHAGPECLSDRSKELLSRFIRAIPSQDPETFAVEAKKQAGALVKGFNAQELSVAVEELSKEAAQHEKVHADEECTLPACLRALAEVVKETARTQLQ